MRIAKKLIALLLILTLTMPLLPAFGEADQADEPVFDEVPIYYFRSTNVDSLPIAFFNGCTDIPYCSVYNIAVLLNTLAKKLGDNDYTLHAGYTTYRELEDANMLSIGENTDPDCKVYYILRENGALMLFNYDDNVIWFSDRDLFLVNSYAVSGGDLVSSDGIYYYNDGTIAWNDAKDEAYTNLYRRVKSNSYKREGEVIEIQLNDYNIAIELYDGEFYVPLATMADLVTPVPVAYNGEAVFAFLDGSPDDNTLDDEDHTQKDLYYMPGPRERSEELAIFTYNELCLMLDNNYGLKAEHGVFYGFDEYFIDSGLQADLCSTDNAVFTNALIQVLDGYFGDMHSGMNAYSPYTGLSFESSSKNVSVSVRDYIQLRNRFRDAREAAGITSDYQILNGYTEIGDTAFVTFDKFKSASANYYNPDLWENFSDIYMSDTISLVMWAHSQIHRQDSPIRKVVIDLSCNGGGSIDACVYIASWVLGVANLSIENVDTGAQYTTAYWVDVDRDGMCLKEDELGVDKLDVYCLVNGSSFSCGNLLPTLFKQDGRVTLLGQTTGGGACPVRNAVAADGTLFSISDYYRLCIVKNGSFYSIDRGVEADIPLRKPASYYDREALAAYLDTIR